MYQTTYHRPSSVDEAAAAFAKGTEAKYLAGGHTLIPVMKQRLASPSDVIDLCKIKELIGIELSGDTRHQEIRFVRIAGQQPQLILGRNPGRSPQHVALNSSTVSRQHARLAYSGGKWAVANLSQTNPVVVNDQELTNLDGERQLADGDRIELGEVVLRFHAH